MHACICNNITAHQKPSSINRQHEAIHHQSINQQITHPTQSRCIERQDRKKRKISNSLLGNVEYVRNQHHVSKRFIICFDVHEYTWENENRTRPVCTDHSNTTGESAGMFRSKPADQRSLGRSSFRTRVKKIKKYNVATGYHNRCSPSHMNRIQVRRWYKRKDFWGA